MSHGCQLYLVTDEGLPTAQLCHVVTEAVRGGVGMVQLREKHRHTAAFMARALAVKAALAGTGVPLIINDRIDVALAVEAEGVHLGQDDMPVSHARRLLGSRRLIGLSVETEQQLLEAQSLPVDHLGLSAVFATPTKTDIRHCWGLAGLRWARAHSRLPLVAIGGLNAANLKAVADSGADSVAVVSAICAAADPFAAARQLSELLAGTGAQPYLDNNIFVT